MKIGLDRLPDPLKVMNEKLADVLDPYKIEVSQLQYADRVDILFILKEGISIQKIMQAMGVKEWKITDRFYFDDEDDSIATLYIRSPCFEEWGLTVTECSKPGNNWLKLGWITGKI